jgi:TRAP-type mannitol/chloroaromatic compound transport system substrate-binding protein
MKKGLLVSVMLAFFISITLSAVSEAQQTLPTIKWRMATVRTPNLTPFYEGDLHFADMIRLPCTPPAN